jgi:hypothetical protein
VRSIRKIAPFISAALIVLIISGSLGYTLIRHNCMHCGTDEVIAMVGANDDEDFCCCIHSGAEGTHHHSTGEAVFSDDCCSHEAERIVTDELVRTEVQDELIPYFEAAMVIARIPELPGPAYITVFHDNPFHRGPELTKMICQIRS